MIPLRRPCGVWSRTPFCMVVFSTFSANTIYLYLFGPYIEQTLGKFYFAVFYIAGGVMAALAHHVFGGEAPVVGASGAIAALLAAFFCLRPWADVRNLFVYWFIIYIGSFRINIPAFIYFPIFFILNNVTGVALDDGSSSVAYWAHFGGFGFGYAAMFALYGFSGWKEAKEPQVWFKKQVKRRKMLKSSPADMEQLLSMDTRLAASNILHDVLEVGDAELVVAAYHKAMSKYPNLMLEPDMQERLAALMEKGGYPVDALHAYEKLIQNVPRSVEGHRSYLAAGTLCASIPDKYETGRHYVREFLDQFTTAELRIKAERVLASIEDAIRAQGLEPEPMAPIAPLPGSRPAIDQKNVPVEFRSPNYKPPDPPPPKEGPPREEPSSISLSISDPVDEAPTPPMRNHGRHGRMRYRRQSIR